MSLYQVATFGGMALGSWVWGALAEQMGVGAAMLASAVTLLLGAALGLRYALPEMEALNLDPLRAWTEPETALDILPKMQGIAEIHDGALVVRFKFTSKPGKSTLIQRQAMSLVYQRFPQYGINFAGGAPALPAKVDAE